MNRTTRAVVIALAFLTGACRMNYTVRPTVSCGSVLQLHVGASQGTVESLLGKPNFGEQKPSKLVDGNEYDSYLGYGPFESPDGFFRAWDHFEVYFRGGHLLEAVSTRQYWGRAQQVLALRIRPASGGNGEVREVGSDFENVFGCGSSWSRGQLPSDFRITR